MKLISVVDVEATGLGRFDKANPFDDDYPVSIGIVVASIQEDEGMIRCMDSLHTLIRIPNPIRVLESTVFHHIWPDDLEDAPLPNDVCQQIISLYGRYGEMPVGAWNHQVDRYFVDILFRMGKTKKPALKWMELQPEKSACLDKFVARYVRDPEILKLDAHDALNDCIRALGVIAALNGCDLDISGIKTNHDN